MQITLPQLPYPYDALEPHISRTTLEIHHGKHHRAYVEKVKTLAREVHLADQPLERIIQQTAGQDSHRVQIPMKSPGRSEMMAPMDSDMMSPRA